MGEVEGGRHRHSDIQANCLLLGGALPSRRKHV